MADEQAVALLNGLILPLSAKLLAQISWT